jgi:hypothetical protein
VKPTLLDELTSDRFNDSVGFVLPPQPMRRTLQRHPTVKALETGVRYGQVTESQVRQFVSKVLAEYRIGDVFKYDVALAALAVALEHWHHPCAEEYLHDLARLQRREFRLSFRVAGECLKARYAFPRNKVRTMTYARMGQIPNLVNSGRKMTESTNRRQVHWVKYDEVNYASA